MMKAVEGVPHPSKGAERCTREFRLLVQSYRLNIVEVERAIRACMPKGTKLSQEVVKTRSASGHIEQEPVTAPTMFTDEVSGKTL